MIVFQSLNKKEQVEKPKNAPSISRQANNEEDGYDNDGAIDKEQDNSNSDSTDEEYYATIRQLRSRNGLAAHEYQQICDEMNRAFTENIQKYERKEQQSKRDNHRLQVVKYYSSRFIMHAFMKKGIIIDIDDIILFIDGVG